MFLQTLFALAAPVAAFALPSLSPRAPQTCDVTSAQLPPLPGYTGEWPPAVTGHYPVNIAIGTGTQNYTCTNGQYASKGAVAKLYDISCTYNTPEWEDTTYATPLGDHYFVPNTYTGNGISPYFIKTYGDEHVYTTLNRVAGYTAPYPEENIEWLRLESYAGTWAHTVFRVETRGGQPPATCYEEGHEITVPYHSQYWFYY